MFVILDTNLDEDLIKEGYVREVISKVQQMRKNNDYDVTDRIDITIDCDDVIKASIEEFEDYLKKETLCDDIIYSKNEGNSVKLNDREAVITLVQK